MDNAVRGFIKAATFLLIIFSIIYIVGYQNWEEKDFGNTDYSQYFDEEPQLKEEEKVNMDEAKKIYKTINFKMIQENFGEEFFDIYYKNNNIGTKKFSSEFIIYLAVINMKKNDFLIACNNSYEISSGMLDETIKSIFGNIEYEKKSFETKDKSLSIEYDNITDSFLVTNYRCSGISFGEGHIETEFATAKLNDEFLEITEYVYYLSYSYDDNGGYLLNYHNGLDSNSLVIATSKDNEIDKSKMLRYKYILKKDKDQNYKFQNVVKIG